MRQPAAVGPEHLLRNLVACLNEGKEHVDAEGDGVAGATEVQAVVEHEELGVGHGFAGLVLGDGGHGDGHEHRDVDAEDRAGMHAEEPDEVGDGHDGDHGDGRGAKVHERSDNQLLDELEDVAKRGCHEAPLDEEHHCEDDHGREGGRERV